MTGGDSSAAKEVVHHPSKHWTDPDPDPDQYQQTQKEENSVLGNAKIPDQFAPHGSTGPTKGKQRETFLCVNFFLRQKDVHCPSRWRHSAQWVFELINTYLR
jgi:hypothetical protein